MISASDSKPSTCFKKGRAMVSLEPTNLRSSKSLFSDPPPQPQPQAVGVKSWAENE